MSQSNKKQPKTRPESPANLGDFSAPLIVAPAAKSGWKNALAIMLVSGVLFLLVGILVGLLLSGRWPAQWPGNLSALLAATPPRPVALKLATPTPIPVGTPAAVTPTRGATPPTPDFLPTPPVTGGGTMLPLIPTPPAGGVVIGLTPAAENVGWASSLDGQAHFNDPNIHVGVFNGHVYRGAIQFDLSSVPPASKIKYAAIEMVGLSNQNLSRGGNWQVRMLNPDADALWPDMDYELLADAEVQISILPGLTSASLTPERVNVFPFGPEQLAALQQRLAGGAVSFRIDGPGKDDANNLFTWDSGLLGEQKLAQNPPSPDQTSDEAWVRLSRKPILWIVTNPVAYVAVTPSPTPENMFTVAAMAATATVEARDYGTATPLPAEWVTPLVVTVPPPPGNPATAEYRARLMTAEAVAYGTATPTPLNVWTATPTPDKVFVTSTPTPENVITAAAVAARATYVAQVTGTYTPVPGNWATPFVATPRPAPGNAATAEYYSLEATAEAFLYGIVWTATPTAIYTTPTPAPTYTATPGYEPVPQQLVGKIAFLSDRAGSQEETGLEPQVYVMDADGSNVTLLSDRAVYDTALARDSFSADQRFRAYVEDFLRFDGQRVPGIYYQDSYYSATEQLTRFGKGIAWMPAWSPTREQIAFVSNETDNDEIWIINRDGSNLLRLTAGNAPSNAERIGKDDFFPLVSRHPSWSPDGDQLVYWSNSSGNAQIWLSTIDGSQQRIIHPSPYNDWNPVWIKYTDTPPLLPEPTPVRKNPFDLFN